jgi:hypothetical protein
MSAYYRSLSLFTHSTSKNNEKTLFSTDSFVSPMKTTDEPKRFISTPEDIHKDPVLQSLADKLSTLFPTSGPTASSPLNPPFLRNTTRDSSLETERCQENSIPKNFKTETIANKASLSKFLKEGHGSQRSSSRRLSSSFKNKSISPSSSRYELINATSGNKVDPITELEAKLIIAEQTISKLLNDCESLRDKTNEDENRLGLASEELQACSFLMDVQNQKIRELEVAISNNRLKQNETLSEKTRKHKGEMRHLAKEKKDYESRADAAIAQMHEQFNAFQTMAMSRIEELESELMDERNRANELDMQLEGKQNGLSPVNWKRYTKESVESSSKGSDEDADTSFKSDNSEVESKHNRKQGRKPRRETLMTSRPESKTAEDCDYMNEI